ncbi:MAG: hypothetical protein IPO60_13990 [Flavobacteriales bacterium]|nr:hypothetical protein [Flavobacteriales bacterium]
MDETRYRAMLPAILCAFTPERERPMSRAEKVILAGRWQCWLAWSSRSSLTPKEPTGSPAIRGTVPDPFACGLAYDRLTDLFRRASPPCGEPIYVTAQECIGHRRHRLGQSCIFINSGFRSADDLDQENLLKMVDRGDDAFIAAQYFPDKMMDTLRFRTEYQWKRPDSLAHRRRANKLLRGDTDLVRFTSWPLRQVGLPIHGGIDYIFKNFGMDSVRVLAENQHHVPVLLRMRHGKGSLACGHRVTRRALHQLLPAEGRCAALWKAPSTCCPTGPCCGTSIIKWAARAAGRPYATSSPSLLEMGLLDRHGPTAARTVLVYAPPPGGHPRGNAPTQHQPRVRGHHGAPHTSEETMPTSPESSQSVQGRGPP